MPPAPRPTAPGARGAQVPECELSMAMTAGINKRSWRRSSRAGSMTSLISSLDAYRYLKATMTACSWEAGWRSLLLRAYVDPPEVEELTTRSTADHLIVLVTDGSCDIEGRYRGRWHRTHYRPGSLGMTAPG